MGLVVRPVVRQARLAQVRILLLALLSPLFHVVQAAATAAAIARDRVYLEIFTGKQVTVSAIKTARPALVLGVRHRLQMLRLHAKRRFAEVVENQAIGNRTNQDFVGETVGLNRDLDAGALDREAAVAPLVLGARPEPAAFALFNLGPKVLENGRGNLNPHREVSSRGAGRLGVLSAVAALLTGIAVGFIFINLTANASQAAGACYGVYNPPCAPHPDQFLYNGLSLAPLNPVNQKALAPAHTVSYSLATESGCNTGSIPQAMQRVEQELSAKVAFHLVRDDARPDFKVRISCGSNQIRYCGAVTIFCLPDGYPYNTNIALSDLLSTYTQESQLAIPLHEVLHAIATFNEQYCLGSEASGPCAGLSRFASTPNWHDVMNTGPESRHGLEAIELERWSRTMYDLAPPAEYQDCTTYAGWEPTVSCYWPALGKWLWLVPAATGDQIWEWSTANPQWTCSKGCPK